MIRKSLLAFAIFGVFAAAAGCTQTPPSSDTAADQAKLKSDALIWFDYYAKADADGMANLYAEDALLMPPGAPAVTGRPGIKKFHHRFYDEISTSDPGNSLQNTFSISSVEAGTAK